MIRSILSTCLAIVLCLVLALLVAGWLLLRPVLRILQKPSDDEDDDGGAL